MSERIRKFWSDEEAQSAVEYALVMAFVVIGLVAAAYAMAPTIAEGMDKLAHNIAYWLSGKSGSS